MHRSYWILLHILNEDLSGELVSAAYLLPNDTLWYRSIATNLICEGHLLHLFWIDLHVVKFKLLSFSLCSFQLALEEFDFLLFHLLLDKLLYWAYVNVRSKLLHIVLIVVGRKVWRRCHVKHLSCVFVLSSRRCSRFATILDVARSDLCSKQLIDPHSADHHLLRTSCFLASFSAYVLKLKWLLILLLFFSIDWRHIRASLDLAHRVILFAFTSQFYPAVNYSRHKHRIALLHETLPGYRWD